jgi:hypothetical protein
VPAARHQLPAHRLAQTRRQRARKTPRQCLLLPLSPDAGGRRIAHDEQPQRAARLRALARRLGQAQRGGAHPPPLPQQQRPQQQLGQRHPHAGMLQVATASAKSDSILPLRPA